MRHIPKNEWYLDKCTWCGVTKGGERYYPVSWNDDGYTEVNDGVLRRGD